MEMKFNEKDCHCLRRVTDQLQIREQTQEVRLPDGMPDIGRVLGCWGQAIIRGKEWRGGSIGINGGIQGWVMYLPEDGTQPRSVEIWIPFQMKWDIPQTQHDGFIWVSPCVHSMDARNTSARKLMVRANVGVLGRGLESSETAVFAPEDVPEDVQMRNACYPMVLPMEYGERLLDVQEEWEQPVETILRWELKLCPQEQKVMASRLVFRGTGTLHLVYSDGEGIHTRTWQIPFSQFADLDREHSANASAQILPVLTEAELEAAEGKLRLKAGIAAQYVIFDRTLVELVEDAYSPVRTVQPQMQMLRLPAELDRTTVPVQISREFPIQSSRVVDVSWMQEHPQLRQEGETALLTVPGRFQALYYDDQGVLQCGLYPCEHTLQIAADSETAVDATAWSEDMPQAMIRGEGIELSTGIQLDTAVTGNGAQPMVSGLELGELRQPDPDRPSMILRRCDGSGLWSMAKCCGSTVDAIRRANGLQEEPEPGRMLLIPVC